MFKNLYFLIFPALLFSCGSNNQSEHESTYDTLQTASGLRYFYIAHGSGREVETGSKVGTILSLKVGEDVVWTSYNEEDSIFSFVANGDRVIEGFNEMALLLREGDEVVAILPDSIAYGDEGAGSLIPPNATLVYDVFKIAKVGEPKAILSDTLFATYGRSGIAGVLEQHNEIGNDSVNYYVGTEEIIKLWDKLTDAGMHEDALTLTANFDNYYINYYGLLSLENLGQYQRAIDSLDLMIAEYPDIMEFQEFKAKMQQQLNQ